MKVCNKCKEEKSLEEFTNNRVNPDGKERRCKICRSSYMKEYNSTDNAKKLKKENRDKFKNRNRDYIKEILQKSGCTDCKETNWIVLEFDHLDDKVLDISRLMNDNRLAFLVKEVAKCEVVCSNCHRLRTYKRNSSWRLAQ